MKLSSRIGLAGCALLGSLSLSPAPAAADLIIDVKDTLIQAGGLGTVDITIRSTSVDQFAAANYLLRIVPIFEIASDLQFRDSGTGSTMSVDRQMPSEQLDSSYVFATKVDPANFAATRQNPDTRGLVGTDFSADFTDVTVTTSELLLARVELQHISPSPFASSGQYRISLVEAPGDTFFIAADFATVPIDSSSYATDNAFGSSFGSGIVTVTSVPEPSTALLLSIGGIAAIAARRRRWKSC